MRQLVCQVCYTKCQVSFYLWLARPAPKHCKVPKHYDQDYLKIFFFLSTVPMRIQIYEKNAHLVQKR